MTQEDKELLLKDLCARLPYGIKVQVFNYGIETVETLYQIDLDGYISTIEGDELKYSYKPYLFPLSSMTEEQKEEYADLQQRVIYNGKGVVNLDVAKYVGWCYKHYIDINNLIPMGLAIDATGLNIY